MAEYAEDRRYVRAAARGFSPEPECCMLREKALLQRSLPFVLERRTTVLQRQKGRTSQMMPRAFCWKGFHRRQKRKFFEKKRNKTNELPRDIFYDCFFIPIAVLYYGIFPVIVWMKKEEIR